MRLVPHPCRPALTALAALLLAGPAAADDIAVSQKGRAFVPLQVEISRNDSLRLTNDDAVVHQAYVETAGFTADTGEINPGQAAALAFPQAGSFTVLCRIHPKMHLQVTVR